MNFQAALGQRRPDQPTDGEEEDRHRAARREATHRRSCCSRNLGNWIHFPPGLQSVLGLQAHQHVRPLHSFTASLVISSSFLDPGCVTDH